MYTMPEKNIIIFTKSMEYLYGKHCRLCEPEASSYTELAFNEDKIGTQSNTISLVEIRNKPEIIKNNMIEPIIPTISSPEIINTPSSPAKKKPGRPRKELMISSVPIPPKRSVGRPPKYSKDDPFPK